MASLAPLVPSSWSAVAEMAIGEVADRLLSVCVLACKCLRGAAVGKLAWVLRSGPRFPLSIVRLRGSARFLVSRREFVFERFSRQGSMNDFFFAIYFLFSRDGRSLDTPGSWPSDGGGARDSPSGLFGSWELVPFCLRVAWEACGPGEVSGCCGLGVLVVHPAGARA